jgi:tryptophan-rich sensory protein
MKVNYFKLIICILICLGAGLIGSLFTAPSIDSWYSELIKPSFNPPSWIFSPVWTILFILMGISLYIVLEKGIKKKYYKTALVIFGVQLFLNLLWSIIFFSLHSPFFAFIEIIFLLVAIIFTIVYFYKISKISAYLLIPYLVWVSFASILNFMIFWLN